MAAGRSGKKWEGKSYGPELLLLLVVLRLQVEDRWWMISCTPPPRRALDRDAMTIMGKLPVVSIPRLNVVDRERVERRPCPG